MIFDKDFLTEEEVRGIESMLDNPRNALLYQFIDDNHGLRFVYWAKWKDEITTKVEPMVVGILNRFADKHGIEVKSVRSAKVIALPQDEKGRRYIREVEDNIPNYFLYFFSDFDTHVRVGANSFVPKAGDAAAFDITEPYFLTRPRHMPVALALEIVYE